MNLEQIATCIKVLDEISAGFAAMHLGDADSAHAGLACVIAQSIIVEYAAYRTDGYSHDEAMKLTAAKQQPQSEATASLRGLLTREDR
jgi:hypothetical protein